MATAPNIRVPPIKFQVYTQEQSPESALQEAFAPVGMRGYANQLQQVLSQATASVCLVPLKNEQLQCVSCLHPSTTQNWCISSVCGTSTVLKEQTCTLSAQMQDIIEPSMTLRIEYVKPAETANAGETQKSAAIVKTKHLMTVSLPLAQMFNDFLTAGKCVHQTTTSEDNGRMWQVHFFMDDGAQLSTTNERRRSLGQQLETLNVHKAYMLQHVGVCESVKQMATYVTLCRTERKDAIAKVLGRLTSDKLPSTWELQFSRTLGMTAPTFDCAATPVMLDNTQIQFVREGSHSGGQAEQTSLLLANALATVIVQNAQAAGVQMGYNSGNQSSVFDPAAVHDANVAFVQQQGPAELMHHVQYAMQELLCSQSTYDKDPAYETCIKINASHIDNSGRGQLAVETELRLSKNAGEDQVTGVGICIGQKGPEDHDCEDYAAGNGAVTSSMRCTPKALFLEQMQGAIQVLPPDTQQIQATILELAGILHTYENSNKQRLDTPAQTVIPLNDLNVLKLREAVANASNTANIVSTGTCSLLAKAPEIAKIDNNNSRDVMLRDMKTSSQTFFNWWGTTRDNGLNGHSVCINIPCQHVLGTVVGKVPVTITLIDSENVQIIEGTGVARQKSDPCTQVAVLNVGNSTLQRMNLQQRLDNGKLLNTCLAACIKSSLHADELKQKLACLALGNHNLQLPGISAIQSYSITGTPSSEKERDVTVGSLFYAVLLSCDLGGVLSFDMQQSAALKMQQGEQMTTALESTTNGTQQVLLPGTPFVKGLLPQDVKSIIVAANCTQGEQMRLRALGAFMSLNKVNAASAMQKSQASIMPLHLRQRMTMCNNCLVPLTPAQVVTAQKLSCGIFIRTPFVKPAQGSQYTNVNEIHMNMHNILSHTTQIVGCAPVITGTGFSDSMTVVYP